MSGIEHSERDGERCAGIVMIARYVRGHTVATANLMHTRSDECGEPKKPATCAPGGDPVMTAAENHLIELLPRSDRRRLLAICEPTDLAMAQVLHEIGS